MRPAAERFGHQELDRVKWRARATIAGLALSAVFVTFIALPPPRLVHLFEEQISEAEISAALEVARLHGPTALLVVLVSGLVLFGLRRVRRRVQASKAAAARAMPLHAPAVRIDRTGVMCGGKQLKRPSFLPERHVDAPRPGQEAGMPHGTGPNDQSAAGFLMRLRQSLALAEGEADAVTQAPPVSKLVRHPRFRRVAQAAKEAASSTAPMPDEQDAAALKPNELRRYLKNRLASGGLHGSRKPRAVVPEPSREETGPALTSLDTLLDHVFAAGRGGAPRALLVAGASARIDATAEAVSIARALAAGGDQVVLVDLACGQASIFDTLGLPPSSGLSELFTGRAGFEDIVRVDPATTLQVIAAGNPKPAASIAGNERFASVFEALTQAYDGVVLHADSEALDRFTPALRFELSVAIAVADAGTGAGGAEIDLREFSPLGCPVLVYEQGSKELRSRSLAAPVSLAAASNE